MTNRGSFNRRLRLGAAACVCLLVLVGSAAWAAGPPVGEWETTVTRGDQQFTSTISLQRDDEGRLIGHWTTGRGQTALEGVSYEDGQLQFTRRLTRGERTFESTFSGRIEEGYRLVGTFTSPRGERPFSAILRDGAEPFLGDWAITQTWGGREVTSTLSISRGEDGGLRGVWTTPRGESQLQNVQHADGQLTFARQIRFQDQQFEMSFRGRVEDGRLLGTFTTARGESAVTGVRPEPEEEEEEEEETDQELRQTAANA